MPCEVCGNASNGMLLCKYHYKLKMENKLKKCQKCEKLTEKDKLLCYSCYIRENSAVICFNCKINASLIHHDEFGDVWNCKKCGNVWQMRAEATNDVERILALFYNKEYLSWEKIESWADLSQDEIRAALKRLFRTKRITKKFDKYYYLTDEEKENYAKLETERLSLIESKKLKFLSKQEKTSLSDKIASNIYYDSDLYQKILEILKKAQSSIKITSPWIYGMGHIKDILVEKRQQNVDIHLIIRSLEEGSTETQRKAQKNLKHVLEDNKVKIYYDIDLHAKLLIIDDKEILVSSANLTTKSLLSNHELGIWSKDENLVKETIRYFEKLCKQKAYDWK